MGTIHVPCKSIGPAPISFPDNFHIQYLLKILCLTPPHLNTIHQYLIAHILYHLILSLITLPHSLYLILKRIFNFFKIIPQLLSPLPICHSFHNIYCLFHHCSLYLVAAIWIHISSLQLSFKMLTFQTLPHQLFQSTIHCPSFFLPHMSHALVHLFTISMNFSHSLSTLMT